MNRTIVTAALACLATTVGLPSAAAAQDVPKVGSELIARAAQGSVRVVVLLDLSGRLEPRDSPSRDTRAEPETIARAQDALLTAVEGLESPTRFETLPAVAVTVDAPTLARLAQDDGVARVYEDRRFFPALRDTTALLHADRLWAQGVEGAGWNVAVLDTGVETTHSFFAGRVTSEACYSTNATIGAVQATSLCPAAASQSTAVGSGVNCQLPTCNHGTLVAGIAAGRNSNVTGVARRANIVSIKVFSQLAGTNACGPGQSGPCAGAFESDIVRGLERVAALAGPGNAGRIAAVNLSVAGALSPGTCDASLPLLHAAATNLRAMGIPTIVPSGNNASSTQLAEPACLSSVISVASSGKTDLFSGFGNRSPLLRLVAPGEHVETSALGDDYLAATGTSMAAPHVAGAWALLKGIVPDVSVDTALNAFRRTGVPLADPFTPANSYPRIVVDRAAGSLGPPGSPTSVLVSTLGSTATVTWSNPFDGTVPQRFVLEVAQASNPNVVIAAVDVGATYFATATVPPGHYLVRVRSITVFGPAPASNFVPFSIGTLPITAPPDAPDDLRATVNLVAHSVTLQWNLRTDSAPAQSYLIDVGTAPGVVNVGTFDTMSAATSVTVPTVFPGTYYARVRARNVIGVSGSSNEVSVYVPATGCAPAPTDLTATVFGPVVTLAWNPPFSGSVIGYTIEVGSRSGLANLLSVPVGNQRSITAGVPSGVYFVRVRTRTGLCATGTPSNEVVVVVP